jgi:hypothetical protein
MASARSASKLATARSMDFSDAQVEPSEFRLIAVIRELDGTRVWKLHTDVLSKSR